MLRRIAPLLPALLAAALVSSAPAATATVTIAAASNFTYALDALHAGFRQANPDTDLVVSLGASGSLYAQIERGAPFDILLSADTDYPRQLIAAGLGPADSLRIFASGRLVLWTTRAGLALDDLPTLLRQPGIRRIALAQPRSSPYGKASQAVLERLALWQEVRPRLVLGENITQTAQFVETGGADVGFIALALVLSPRLADRGRWREIPASLHPQSPLDHAAVLTMRGATNPAARRYLDFLTSGDAARILHVRGYGPPSVER